MSDYRVLLWDFDGTLADTLGELLRIYNRVAARDGYRPITDPDVVRRSAPVALLRSHGIPLLRVPFLIREVLLAQRERMASTRLFPGLEDLLSDLHRQGYRQGVVSSNNEVNIRACLRANGLEHLFDCVIGCSRLLGKGRALRRVRRLWSAHPEQVLYIGDEVRDIEAARSAGIAVAAVTWGFHGADLLRRRQPDYLIEHPARLAELLEAVRAVNG